MLGADASRGAVGPPEDDGHRLAAGGHVVGLGRGVDDLVDGLHGEVEGHELTDGPETSLQGRIGQQQRLVTAHCSSTLTTCLDSESAESHARLPVAAGFLRVVLSVVQASTGCSVAATLCMHPPHILMADANYPCVDSSVKRMLKS